MLEQFEGQVHAGAVGQLCSFRIDDTAVSIVVLFENLVEVVHASGDVGRRASELLCVDAGFQMYAFRPDVRVYAVEFYDFLTGLLSGYITLILTLIFGRKVVPKRGTDLIDVILVLHGTDLLILDCEISCKNVLKSSSGLSNCFSHSKL